MGEECDWGDICVSCSYCIQYLGFSSFSCLSLNSMHCIFKNFFNWTCPVDQQGRMHHVQYVSLEHSAQNITLRNVLEKSSLALPPSPGMNRTVSHLKAAVLGGFALHEPTSWGLWNTQLLFWYPQSPGLSHFRYVWRALPARRFELCVLGGSGLILVITQLIRTVYY